MKTLKGYNIKDIVQIKAKEPAMQSNQLVQQAQGSSELGKFEE
jgi:hypothetical protein